MKVFILFIISILSALVLAQSVEKQVTRVARLPTCPPDEALKEKCPGGAVQVEGYCLCFTGAKDVVGEEKVAPNNRMIICEVEGDDGKKFLQVRYENEIGPLDAGCILVIEGILFPGVSMAGMETGTEEKLRVRCAPCPISSKSWSHCPYCLHPSYKLSCDKACLVKEAVP